MDFSRTEIRKTKETESIEKLPKDFLCGLDGNIGEIYHLHTPEILGLKFHSLPSSNGHIRNKKSQNVTIFVTYVTTWV